ncbi:uncharacterized protein KY384_005100 [Bacidia gigantensis]|uniref:uncharacterized protein n=1 Tax=Bacidia gigantensis TaxID=2732470 RepID=UPI001D03C9FE|nr:uncharacterized protein KY384_005100 [Bacidia gigantensis]KAG8529620.1 hypothetical protein KY384_005100 [Bacidia gigantensis]
MASSSAWKDQLKSVEGTYHVLYKLLNPGDIALPATDGLDSTAIHQFFNNYCRGDDDYYKIAPKQSQLLGVPYPTYISSVFIHQAVAANGSYEWHKHRNRPYNDYRLKGGYIMPGRALGGACKLYELPTNLTTFLHSKTWSDLFEASTSIWKGDNDITAMRAYYPAPGEMTLIIRPYGAGPTVKEDVSLWTRNGVPFDRVRAAFEQIQDSSAVKYVFDFSVEDTEYYHTEGLIQELSEQLQPSENAELYQDRLVYREHGMAGTTLPNSSKGNLNPSQEAKLTYDQHCCFIPLQAEKMIAAVGKRKGTVSQTSVMNKISAPKLAKEVFKWDPAKRMGAPHIAEWLRLSAFAYGGVVSEEETEAWNSSQIQLNMVFGSSETNSVMLRVEKAWQEFYKFEHELRALYRAADKDASFSPVTDFYPFTRLFFTKGESQVDLKLLKDVFEDKKKELEQHLSLHQQEPPNAPVSDAPLFVSQSISMEVIDENPNILQNGHDQWQDGILEENEAAMQEEPSGPLEVNFDSRLHTEAIEDAPFVLRSPMVDSKLEDEQPAFPEVEEVNGDTSGPKPSAETSLLGTQPPQANGSTFLDLNNLANATLEDLEVNLIKSDEFNRVQALDDVFDPKAFGLRNTLTSSGNTDNETDQATNESGLPMMNREQNLEVMDNEAKTIHEPKAPGSQSRQTEPQPVSSSEFQNEQSTELNGTGLNDPVLIIGGVIVENPKLVTATDTGTFADIPALIQSVAIPATSEALLLAPLTDTLEGAKPFEPPTLLLSAVERSDVQVPGHSSTSLDEIKASAIQTSSRVGTAALSTYELSVDVKQLFGINGLSAQLYTLQSSDPTLPVFERVKPNITQPPLNPIIALFPYMQDKVMTVIPIQNFELIYSEDRHDFLHAPGLRIQADILFEGALQPVADSLQYLFGEKNVAPKSLHVTAHLASERNWSVMPVVTTLCLQGSFQNISFRIGEILKFTSIGVEVSATKVSTIGSENRWRFGYGFFGSLQIRGLNGGDLPTLVDYRLRKTGDLYRMSMRLSSDEWQSVFGIEALTVRQVQFETSFSSKAFKESLSIRISAFMTLRKAQVFLTGQYSKAESFLQAEIGNFSWAEVRELYAELTGQSVPADTGGNDLHFENLYLRISNKGIGLGGSVTFNGHSSAYAFISLDTNGLQISGGIKDFIIPDADIHIKEAGLDIFVASSSQGTPSAKATRSSKFSIHEWSFSVNAFKIGPLEVKSAKGAPDASMEIVMTSDEQKFFVDGMIKLLAFEAKIYLNISLQPSVAFDIDIDIRFAEVFKFILKAKAQNSDLKDLSKADLDLRAELSGDVFGAICDAVIGVLGKIEELGDEGFQAVDQQLQSEIGQMNQQLEGMAQEVEEARINTNTERARRDRLFKTEELKRQNAQKELQTLKDNVTEAKDKQAADFVAAKEKLRQAETHRETMVQNKRVEYDDKLRNAQNEQSRVQREHGALEQQMRDKYGPIRIMQVNRDGQVSKLTVQQVIVNQIRREFDQLENEFNRANVFKKAALVFPLGIKKTQLEGANFLLEQLGNAWNFTNSKLNDAGFKSLDEALVRGAGTLGNINTGLQNLQTQGISGFIRAIQQDEDQKVADRLRELRVHENGLQKHIDAIKQAQSLLDSRRPDLESIIARADEAILRTKEDQELSARQVQYDNKVANEARVKQEVEQLRANLTLLHKDFKGAMKDMKDVVEKIKNAAFRITRIAVQVNARDLADGKPMKFEIEGKVGGGSVGPFTIEWAPFETPADLYRRIARKAISL